MKSHLLLIPLLTTSTLFFAGCTAASVNRNLSMTNTNNPVAEVNENANTNTNTNTNTTTNTNVVANENLNTNIETNVNSSIHPDWNTYSSDFYQSDKYLQDSSFPKFTLQYPEDLLVSEDLGGPVFRSSISDFSMSIGYGKNMNLEGCLDYFKKQNAILISDIIRSSWDSIDFISFEQKIADKEDETYCLEQNNKIIIASMTLDREDYFVEILKTIQIEN